jgi:hypothetical protein
MTLDTIFYSDTYTKQIAQHISHETGIKTEKFKLKNPTFNLWASWINQHVHKSNHNKKQLPTRSLLIGGNRWRHHFAIELTTHPIFIFDAHTDMSFDEMVLLKLIRPYNWIYFKLRKGLETHLVLPYDSFRWKRWDMVIPKQHLSRFTLYAVNRKQFKVPVSVSLKDSTIIEVKDPESSKHLSDVQKQISLDFDITREIPEETIFQLLSTAASKDDICDIWLDEGKRGNRRTLTENQASCLKVATILSNT